MVLDITAADEDTLRLVVALSEGRRATFGLAWVRRVPGCPGVTSREYADIRRTGVQGG